MPTIGKEVLSRTKLTEMVMELNDAMDGPSGVALRFTKSGPPRLVCADNDDAVVHLPGDGKPFPVRAYVSALLVAAVLEEEQ